MKLFKARKGDSERTVRDRERQRKNRMVVLRKRQVAAVCLIMLIGIAGYLNLAIQKGEADPNISVMYTEAAKRLGEAKMVNSNETETKEEASGEKNNHVAVNENYFSNAKTEREKKRSESVEMLTELLNSPGADKASKENAQKQIESFARFTDAELKAESMIQAKGYGNCVVFMGENATSVALETGGLNEIDAAVICDLVAECGNLKPEQVKIVEMKPN